MTESSEVNPVREFATWAVLAAGVAGIAVVFDGGAAVSWCLIYFFTIAVSRAELDRFIEHRATQTKEEAA